MKIISEENLRYLSEKKFETEKSNKFTPKVLRDKMIEKFSSLENKEQRILVVESFEFCEDFNDLGFKNVSFMSDNLDKNKFVEGIYGFETFLLNLKETKNIKLNREIEMKFDKVIMNPPYGKLHLPILKKCVEEFVDIENGGEIVSLQPNGWFMDPFINIKNKDNSSIKNNFVCTDIISATVASNIFNCGIMTDLGIFKSTKNNLNTINFFERIYKIYPTTISNVLDKNKRDRIRVVINSVSRKPGSRPYTYKEPYPTLLLNNGFDYDKNIDWTQVRGKGKYIKPIGSNIPYSIEFNNVNTAKNFIESTKTKFFKYLVFNIQFGMSVPNKYLPFMEDYTEPWTDERFYEYFKLTPEEIKTIEDTIK